MSNIFDLLGSVAEQDLTQDMLGGPNIRLRAGERSTFVVDTKTCYITVPADGLSLTRFTVSDQRGMIVVRSTIGVHGEQIGIVDQVDGKDVDVPLPCYQAGAFATWRGWIHIVHTEFMNPDHDAVEALKQRAIDAGFVAYEPRQQIGAEPYQRAEGVTLDFDREAPGDSITDRFRNGLHLDSLVVVPDTRKDASLTEYIDRTSAVITRPAFTSFVDTLVPAMVTALKAAAGDDQKAKRQAFSRLSTLTGYNDETGWPHRPTLGYLTPTGGEEVSLFGDRSTPVEGDAKPSDPAAEPAAAASTSEEPFGD